MVCEKLFAQIDALAGDYLPFWSDICSIESPSDCKAGVDAVGRYFLDAARKKGWECEVFPCEVSGDCIAITLNPHAAGVPVVLSGHMDTVHPLGSFGDPPVKISGNRITGPGAVDCKGGITAAFLAMDALDRIGFRERPVLLLLQSDEEVGSRPSGGATIRFLCEKARGAAAFLNTECMRADILTVRRKGILRCNVTVKGEAAHASSPWRGKSAIAEAAHKILAFEAWKDEDGITANCGMISGGTAANTVPDTCSFTLDIRYATVAQMEWAKQEAQRIADTPTIPGTTAVIEFPGCRPPMEATEGNLALFEKVKAIFEAEGLGTVQAGLGLGGSDASNVSGSGVPSLDSFGVAGGNLHAPGEYAQISSLAVAAKRMAAAVYCL